MVCGADFWRIMKRGIHDAPAYDGGGASRDASTGIRGGSRPSVQERDVGDGRVAAMRPFASLTVLPAAMVARLHRKTEAEHLAFLRGHPMLSPRTRLPGTTMETTADANVRCAARFLIDDGGRMPSQLTGGGLTAAGYEWWLDTVARYGGLFCRKRNDHARPQLTAGRRCPLRLGQPGAVFSSPRAPRRRVLHRLPRQLTEITVRMPTYLCPISSVVRVASNGGRHAHRPNCTAT